MIASQTTLIRTYGTDGEFGNDNGSKNGNKKLTKEQAADLKSKAGLEKYPYILIFGAGHTSYKGSADEEKMYHVYCAIYQETKDSKPWFYDVKYGLINIYGLKAEKQILKKKRGVQCIQRLKMALTIIV